MGGEIVTVSHLDRTMYLLGYVAKENRLYLGDKELNIVSYSLLLSVLEYQTAVMRKDFEIADRILPSVPSQYRTRVAHFLEKQVKIEYLFYKNNYIIFSVILIIIFIKLILLINIYLFIIYKDFNDFIIIV